MLFKQSSEIIPFTANFVDLLPSGETLAGTSTVKVYDSTGSDVSSAMVLLTAISSPNLTGVIQAGTSSDTAFYKITWKAITTPSGYTFEEDQDLQVKDI